MLSDRGFAGAGRSGDDDDLVWWRHVQRKEEILIR